MTSALFSPIRLSSLELANRIVVSPMCQYSAAHAVVFARALKDAGLDFVCISSGGVSADARPNMTANMNVPFAEQVKREAGIATRVVGLIATPKRAEAIVAESKADMVALARHARQSPLGLACRQGARRRGGAPETICARRPQSVAGRHVRGLD
jgi:2,4-dienoyl-CoA reductase-like NADH-dependent reductase (Old Yellow Enzyme family)